MRRLLKIFLILFVILLLAIASAPLWFDVNQYHDRVEGALRQKLARPVTLGRLDLSLVPFALKVKSAVIGEDPRFSTTHPFAQAEELYVSAPLIPLLKGDVQVQALELKQPKIELIRDAQGEWNFSSLGKTPAPQPQQQAVPTAKTTTPGTQQAPAPSAGASAFTLQDLKITDGQLAFTDLRKNQPRAIYDHIDLRLVGYRPGEAFDFALAAHLPGTGNQTLKLEGKAGPIDQQDTLRTPFDGEVALDEVTLSALSKFANNGAATGTDGVATGKFKIKNQAGSVTADGNLQLAQPRIKGHDLGYPISADLQLASDLNTGRLQIQRGNLKLGPTPLSITGSIITTPEPAQLDLRVSAADVSIEEAAHLAAALGVAFNPNMQIAGRLSAEVRAQGPANNPVLNGNIAGRDLVVRGKDLPQPVSAKALQLAFTPSTITSNEFIASTGATSVSMRFTLSQYSTPSPQVDATVRAGNANVGELLNIAKAYGVEAAEGITGSGGASLDVHAIGPLKGAGSMSLSGNGKLLNASLNTPSLRKPLMVHNADITFTRNSAVLQNVSATLGSTNATGSLTASDFTSPVVQFTLNADRIDLAEMQQILVLAPMANTATQSWTLIPRVLAAPPAQPGLITRVTGGGNITAAVVQNDQLVMTSAKATVKLDHGIVRLDPLTTLIYGGQQSGAMVIDMRTIPSRYTVNSKMSNVDANKLLSSVSSMKTLYGMLTGNVQSNFDSHAGASSSDIARSLNGQVNMNLVNGKLTNVDVLAQLANIGKFVGFNLQPKNYTNISKMTGDLNIRNGVAETRNLTAWIDEGTLAFSGNADLANQTLDMRVLAVLNKEFSQQMGGSGIGGYAATALTNKNGELVLPVILSGTFQAPKFSPDYQTIARMKTENIIPSLSQPGKIGDVLGSILGGGSKQPAQTTGGNTSGSTPGSTGQTQSQQPQPAQQQKNPSWTDILGGVLGTKKQPQQSDQSKDQQQQQDQNKKSKDYSEDAPPDQPK